jgi:hypothetical protein
MDLDELLKEDDSSEFPENDGDMDMPDEEDWY